MLNLYCFAKIISDIEFKKQLYMNICMQKA